MISKIRMPANMTSPDDIKDKNACKYDIPTADSLISNEAMDEEEG